MTRRLAQSLVNAGVVKQPEVEEAMQRQVLFGGSLGTNLLESGSVTERELLEGLAASTELPTASKEEIDQIGPHIPRLFPQVFAESYRLVPFKLDGEVLSVMVTGKPDEQLFARIHERLRLTLAPFVTTEVRLHYAMNHLYGSELLPRYRALVSKLDGVMVVQEPGAESSGKVLSWGVSSAHIAKAAPDTKTQPRLNLRELLARLEFATDRDAVVEILLSAATRMFEYTGLFLVQGQSVNGWRGTDPESTQRLARLAIPVELPSVFQTIYATGGHYLGPLPKNSVNAKLLAELGREPPRAAFVAPLEVGGKLAMILYADNGGRSISPRKVAAVLLLTQRITIAFERLIRKRKTTTKPSLAASGRDWNEDAPIEFDLADEHPTPPGEEIHQVSESEFEVVAEGPGATSMADVEAAAAEVQEFVTGEYEAVTFKDVDDTPEASTEAYSAGLAQHGGDETELDSDYVAFADVDDSAEDSLDGWGDVLVETADSMGVEQISHPESEPDAPAPTVSWQDVINEALSASKYVPAAPAPVEVAGTVIDETDLTFDALVAADPQIRRDAIEKLLKMGNAADGYIGQRFPGAVTFDPFDPRSKVPPFPRCSGLLELVLARGTSVAPVVLSFLDHEEPIKRFFAIYYLLAVRCPDALEGLARRLYDTEPRNRHLAADALRTYSNEPGYQRIVAAVRGNIKLPVLESQLHAVQLLGQLRDPASVPELIPLVVAPDQALSRAAASALAVVCSQEFGHDVPAWSKWWQENYNRQRPVWLIQGLRHSSVAMRRIANYELQLLTGMTTHFDPEGPEDDREEKTRMWENWWLHVSKAPAQTPAQPPPVPPGA